VSIVWSYISNKKTNTPVTTETTETTTTDTPKVTNLTNLDPVDFDSTLKGYLDIAATKSAEINKDYKLADIEVEIGQSLQPADATIRYAYNLGATDTSNWIISFAQDTGSYVRSLIPSEDYLGHPKQIDTTLWKFNYVTALQLAEKNGGLEYREKNSDFSSVKMSLKHTGEKAWLLWSVEYKGTTSGLTVLIDANSGDKVTQ
jgi:hypothetical protein